jgi:hypothetical protein
MYEGRKYTKERKEFYGGMKEVYERRRGIGVRCAFDKRAPAGRGGRGVNGGRGG